MIFEFSGDWDQWAVHPAGDEVVYLLDCAVDLVLEADDGERVIELREQSPCCIVPRGVWHTARVPTPSRALHITPGAVTRHRPA